MSHLAGFSLFLSLFYSSPLPPSPNPDQPTNPFFFFHRPFYCHPNPSQSHLLPKGVTKYFLQTHPQLFPREYLVNNILSQLCAFLLIPPISYSYLRRTRHATSKWSVEDLTYLKGEKWDVATCVLSLEDTYKSTAPVARMLWGEPHWGEQWLKIVLDLGYLKGKWWKKLTKEFKVSLKKKEK